MTIRSDTTKSSLQLRTIELRKTQSDRIQERLCVVNRQVNQDNYPAPLTVLNSHSDDRIRSSLSRPFGRAHLPPSYQPKWEVTVEQPMWDTEEGRYKYKINLVRCPTVRRNGEDTRTTTSYNSATTSRSLQDFVWLERALRAEYHGAMLVPLLSLALYFDTSKRCVSEIKAMVILC